MKHLSKLLLASALVGALLAPAAAQVNVVPQTGMITATLNKQTYRAVSIGLVPAASATDLFCIAASASTTIKVTGISVRGVAGTLTSVPLAIVRRATLDTGGTPATGVALPVAGKSDSTNGTAGAVLVAYTANPTITDSSPVYLAAGYVTTPTVAAGTNVPVTDFTFGANLPQFTQQAVLKKGSTEQLCLNGQASTISSGVLNITTSWTEEN